MNAEHGKSDILRREQNGPESQMTQEAVSKMSRSEIKELCILSALEAIDNVKLKKVEKAKLKEMKEKEAKRSGAKDMLERSRKASYEAYEKLENYVIEFPIPEEHPEMGLPEEFAKKYPEGRDAIAQRANETSYAIKVNSQIYDMMLEIEFKELVEMLERNKKELEDRFGQASVYLSTNGVLCPLYKQHPHVADS